MSQVSFENRTVIVTGAGNGLGKAYALDLGSRGAKVVVNDLGGAVDGSGSGSTPADEVVNEIIANGGEAVANYDSVATKEGGESIVQTAIDNFGTVDAVVNNAGILRDKSFAKMEEEDLNAIIDVHLKGTFFVCQPAFIQMIEQGYGRFVNVSSPLSALTLVVTSSNVSVTTGASLRVIVNSSTTFFSTTSGAISSTTSLITFVNLSSTTVSLVSTLISG